MHGRQRSILKTPMRQEMRLWEKRKPDSLEGMTAATDWLATHGPRWYVVPPGHASGEQNMQPARLQLVCTICACHHAAAKLAALLAPLWQNDANSAARHVLRRSWSWRRSRWRSCRDLLRDAVDVASSQHDLTAGDGHHAAPRECRLQHLLRPAASMDAGLGWMHGHSTSKSRQVTSSRPPYAHCRDKKLELQVAAKSKQVYWLKISRHRNLPSASWRFRHCQLASAPRRPAAWLSPARLSALGYG